MQAFLAESEYIDWNDAAVTAKAAELAAGATGKIDIACRCFEFVRDCIRHSNDYKLNPVTCKASDVLRHATGFCYAKSHLLAALLRANGIPAGLCYQRLTIANDVPPYALHGLNAVYLEDHGWYRVDARGNKVGVEAGFCPPREHLAFPVVTQGEMDLPEIWAEPLPAVVQVLTHSKTYLDVLHNLPDVAPAVAGNNGVSICA